MTIGKTTNVMGKTLTDQDRIQDHDAMLSRLVHRIENLETQQSLDTTVIESLCAEMDRLSALENGETKTGTDTTNSKEDTCGSADEKFEPMPDIDDGGIYSVHEGYPIDDPRGSVFPKDDITPEMIEAGRKALAHYNANPELVLEQGAEEIYRAMEAARK